MNELEAYWQRMKDAEQATVHGYYSGLAPTSRSPMGVPEIPTEHTQDPNGGQIDTGKPLVSADECPLKFAEVTMPAGGTFLAILTPWVARNGPGVKLKVQA